MTALPNGPLHPSKRALGLVLPGCFCLLALACFSGEMRQVRWVSLMILFSVGVLLPLAQGLLPWAFRMPLQGVHRLFVLLLLAFSLLFDLRGLNASLTAIPWFLLTGWTAARSIWSWKNQPDFSPASLCLLSAAAFPFVGASWLLAHQAGWMPFGFDAVIVLLTAAHFHHAGFTLPLMAGLLAHQQPGRWTAVSAALVLAGVPLVAAGITCTHFGLLTWVEPLSVTVLVIGALGVATAQIGLGIMSRQRAACRFLWVLSGTSLLAAMFLAWGYGVRLLWPQLALSISGMWAVHGSLNAFGFGLLGIWAWRIGLEQPRNSHS